MKVRNGFVSNSSSSSFCIYGTSMDFGDILEKVKNSNFLTEEEMKMFNEDDDGDDVEWYEVGEMLADKCGLSSYTDYDNDTLWLGLEWSSVGDDETGRQFKDKVKSKLEEMLGPDVDCDTYDETIYN